MSALVLFHSLGIASALLFDLFLGACLVALGSVLGYAHWERSRRRALREEAERIDAHAREVAEHGDGPHRTPGRVTDPCAVGYGTFETLAPKNVLLDHEVFQRLARMTTAARQAGAEYVSMGFTVKETWPADVQVTPARNVRIAPEDLQFNSVSIGPDGFSMGVTYDELGDDEGEE